MVAEHFLKPQDSYNYFTLNTQRKSTHYLFYKSQQNDLTTSDTVVHKKNLFWKVKKVIIVEKMQTVLHINEKLPFIVR